MTGLTPTISSRPASTGQTPEEREGTCAGNTPALRRQSTLPAERLKNQRRTLYKRLERWGLLHEGHTGVPKTHKSDDPENLKAIVLQRFA